MIVSKIPPLFDCVVVALADQVRIKFPPVELLRILREANSRKIMPIFGVGAVVAINYFLLLGKCCPLFDECEGADLAFFRRDFECQ